MATTQPKFAFGSGFVDGFTCPAQCAGYAPDTGDDSTAAADWYDEEASARTGERTGVIDADVAESAWKSVIEQTRDHVECADDPDERAYYESALEVAEEIADELGWL